MKRIVSMLFGFGLIAGLFFGLMALTYWLGALVGGGTWSRLINLVSLMLVGVMVVATFLVLAERKWSALMQDRIGPNRARLPGLEKFSLAGIPHIPADVLKLLFKEDFMPDKANSFLYNLAPMLAFAPAFVLFAVVPAGPTINVDGTIVDMVVATPDFGILFLFALASLTVYGTAIAGWASNNKFALLGGVRASSQMIAYEVALGLSLVGLMLTFSSVQLPALQDAQLGYLWRFTEAGGFDIGLPTWGIFLQPIAAIVFFTASFAEAKRTPFDIPEGESEIIGYFVEYSGMKFGLFMVSEFVEMVVLGAVVVTLFLGGPYLPIGQEWFAAQLATSNPIIYGGLLGMVFWLKVLFLVWVQFLIRWTFPRFRYDQVQTLGWKILLPVGLVNVFATGALVLWDPSFRALAVFGLLQIAVLLILTLSAREPSPTPVPGGGHGGHDHGHGGHGADHGHAAPGGALAGGHSVAHGAGTPAFTSPPPAHGPAGGPSH